MAKRVDVLTDDFILDLLKSCFEKKEIFEIAATHLKISFLPEEKHKKFWKEAVNKFKLNEKPPTLSVLQMEFRGDKDMLELIVEIKEREVEDLDTILDGFDEFLKQLKFLELNQEVVDTYNRGERDKSYSLLVKGTEELSNFSIKSKYFTSVFNGFNERQSERLFADKNKDIIPSGIDPLDYCMGGANGGPQKGDAVLILGDSGSGKSLMMTGIGIHAARLGKKVRHFQAEGTKKQCLDRYDAAWTGTLYIDMKNGIMNDGKFKAIQKIIQKLGRNDIIVEAFEKYGSKTMTDIRHSLKEMEKLHGKADVIIIDYLELMEPGDSKKYSADNERFRQTQIARQCKELAMEFHCIVYTATQANIVNYEMKSDMDFIYTRWNLSEDKGKIRPFDVFVTINMTPDERDDERIRLYVDKLREYLSGQTLPFATNFGYARFYDRKRTVTMLEFEDEEE